MVKAALTVNGVRHEISASPDATLLWIKAQEDAGLDGVIAAGFDSSLATKVIRMVDLVEYKRRQYPPGTKISARAFGKDRRLPVTSRWKER